MHIKGKYVTLRAIEKEDLPLLHLWANDPEIWDMLGGWHFPNSQDSIFKWHDGLRGDTLNQRLVIEVPELGVIGTLNLVEIDWKNRNGFHGILLGKPEARRKGYARDAVMAIERYAFEELGLQRLDTTIIEYNEPSLKLHIEKCGWKEEGRQRKWYFRKNQYWDRVVIGITRDDYFEFVAKTLYWDL